ncbi:protein FAM207A [Oryzias melastigma]|uniref:SLX9 ribosome biogenesis factor n=1 Tax=Oryzias melastigma TaxID=30732 RepID=A0A3B3DDE1_ORYME|nr:protein FAM207A [Oryzias melastigma]
MVGKIKHVRQKLHQEAVKLRGPDRTPQAGPETVLPGIARPAAVLPAGKAPLGEKVPTQTSARAQQVLSGSSFPSSIFVGTKISAETLVQRLDHPEPADVPQITSKGSEEEKKAKSKKEKMKERRERWLSKISSIKQVKEQQLAEARRKATPVVGDMRPLADALPQLSELMAPAAAAPTSRRKSRKNKLPVKKAVPTDFSQMKQAQKRRLLETESLSFSRAVKAMATMKNPLADIGEQLRKRMRQEEEQAPS